MLSRVLQTARFSLTGLLALAALSVAVTAAADNIYKYQDENGIWHFTDRAPQEGVEFEVVFMEREVEARLKLRQEGTKRNPLYHVYNDLYGPVEVEIKLTDAINVLSEPELPARFVIPARKEKLLVGLGALDPQMGFQYRIHVASIPGPPLATPVQLTLQAVVEETPGVWRVANGVILDVR